ncbi:MAG: DUF502 domain-containing protein [Pseudomonadota bacterium]
MGRVRRYLIAGLLIWIPIGITIVVFRFLLGQMNKSLGLLPREHVPSFVFEIPYLGVILTFLLLLVTGLLTANIFGRTLVGWSEKLLHRIPLIRAVYSASKNFAEVVFSDSGESFKKVLLIEYPRKGVWSLAFMTSNQLGEVQHRTGTDVICTFVPTTPNPTSGFIIMVPKEDAIMLDMPVEEALKMIISLGVVVPEWNPGKPLPEVATTADNT